MTERAIKIPGPDHPITIVRNPNRVVVKLDGLAIVTGASNGIGAAVAKTLAANGAAVVVTTL